MVRNMVKRDILQEMHDGQLTLDQARTLYDEYMDAGHENIHEVLGFSQIEWTAYCHGTPFHKLMSWRYDGWPNICPKCGREINIDRFRWFVREWKGDLRLLHIDCL